MTRVFGIIGWPVAHSRSPAMHNAAFRALDIDAVYVPFPVAPRALEAAVAGLRALGVAGFNVTVPHKESVLALLDEVDPIARAIGAVNTVVRDADRLVGTNTDALGLVRALEESGVALGGMRALVLGAGGAARATVAGLATAGAAHITVAARRVERAASLVRDLAAVAPKAALDTVDLGDSEALARSMPCGLLVQATSAGLDPESGAELAARLPWALLAASGARVVDLVYEPSPTPLMLAATQHGLVAEGGLGMLLHQGALAFERFARQPAPLEAMRKTLVVSRG